VLKVQFRGAIEAAIPLLIGMLNDSDPDDGSPAASALGKLVEHGKCLPGAIATLLTNSQSSIP
jgi:HEAT repeat protein